MMRRISRRCVLRGLGATVALPWLEAMAQALPRPRRTAAPVRMAILYMPNGVYPPAWTPADSTAAGRDFELSPTLSPLAPVKGDLLVLSGLRNDNSLDGDGHYAKTAPFLTGAKIRRTGGRDLLNAISMDQVAANAIGERTPLPSLELGTEPVRPVEDMGYSTVYGGHISWCSATQPMAKEIVPRLVFDRLFRSAQLRAGDREKSVLDVVRDDAARLERRLGRADREKLEEYLEAVRALERRIDRVTTGEPVLRADDPTLPTKSGSGSGTGLPLSHADHVRLMLDLIILAFRTDTTRVATFMFGNAVSGIDMSFIDGVKGGHHELSHHENRPEKFEPYQRINQWHVAEFAGMLQRMQAIPEGPEPGGTLLDHSMVLFASAMRDGNAHDPNDLPILLAGKGGGTLKTGQHLAFHNPSKLCNLWLAMLQRMGVEAASFGDSSGALL